MNLMIRQKNGKKIMAPPKNNDFWKRRKKSGRDPLFKTAEELEARCDEYFEWVESTPIIRKKTGFYQGEARTYTEELPRAPLLCQLCRSLNITEMTWRNWRKSRDDLAQVMANAESQIWEEKFQGAAVDLYNPNIIAQELGLRLRGEHIVIAQSNENRALTHDDRVMMYLDQKQRMRQALEEMNKEGISYDAE